MRSEPLVLAVDVGSSAVRAAAVDPAGAVVATHRVARPDSSAGLTFDPDLLRAQFAIAVRALPGYARARVAAVGIAGHVGTVFVDRDLRPVGPGLGWADTRGVEALNERLGDRLPRLLREIGRPVLTGGAAAAWLAMEREEPAAAARVDRVLAPKDLLVTHLTGDFTTDRTSAAYTSLSRIADGTWSAEMLNAIGLPERLLPRQIGSIDVAGRVTAATASELGLPHGVPVVAGGPDGTVGAAFVAGEDRGVVADIAGTTDVLVHLVDGPDAAPHEAVINPYPLGGFSAGGPTGMTGGALSRWAGLLGYGGLPKAIAALERRAAEIGPGAAGLRIRPMLSGSRFPQWRPEERGTVWGQHDGHGAEHFLLAVADGAAYVVREGIDRLAAGDAPIGIVALAGGVARSPFLAQLRADVLGRPVRVCSEPDVSLLGAALLAFRGGGIPAALGGASPSDRVVLPAPAPATAYEELFAAWSLTGARVE